jgi:hypothetical protein
MASFPTLFAGSAALYPVTNAQRYPVTVLQFTDRTEQRWAESAPVRRFVLQLDGMTAAERTSIVSFYETMKGGFDSTWDLTLAGTLYSYLCFADEPLVAVEGVDRTWSITLAIQQVRKN